jgi:uncharacterized phage protein (TIGR02218 family)
MPAPKGRTPRNFTPPSTATSLLEHFRGSSITPAICWKVTTADGARVLGFTSHTRNLGPLTGHGATIFRSRGGVLPSNLEASSGLSPSNLEVDAVLSSDAITTADVLRGTWDFASFEIFLVNRQDLTQGDLVIHSGKFGEVKLLGGSFRTEGIGLNQATQTQLGELTRPECRVLDLGDSQCGLALVEGTHKFTTATISTPGGALSTALTIPTSINPAPFTFANGKVRFLAGAGEALEGQTIEIKEWNSASGLLTLKLAAHAPILGGVPVEVTIGCDRKPATCSAMSPTQIKRIRCEPHVPGLEKAYARI